MFISDMIDAWKINKAWEKEYGPALGYQDEVKKRDLPQLEKDLFWWASYVLALDFDENEEDELREAWKKFNSMNFPELMSIIESRVSLFGNQKYVDQINIVYALYAVRKNYPQHCKEALKKASVLKLGIMSRTLLIGFCDESDKALLKSF